MFSLEELPILARGIVFDPHECNSIIDGSLVSNLLLVFINARIYARFTDEPSKHAHNRNDGDSSANQPEELKLRPETWNQTIESTSGRFVPQTNSTSTRRDPQTRQEHFEP